MALEASGVALLPRGAILRDPRALPVAVSSRELPDTLEILRATAPRLQQLGIKHLSIFGSTARGTRRADSDIDLLVDLDEQQSIDLLDYAGIVAELQNLVRQRVDVALRYRLKAHVAPTALRDEIRVF
ncbi:MAG: nucleotidyltransferase family protein [Candidatus Binatus sp.]